MGAEAPKNSDIEILRGVAVSFVLYHHARDLLLPMTADFSERTPYGPAGVDLFFAISGFVIGRSLLPPLRAKSDSRWREVFAFWTRRAFRLLPTAWLWLAIILAVTGVFTFQNPSLDFNTNIQATWAGVFYYANFRFADAFQHYAYGASFQYWSLSLEEQFYILLPLLALLSRKSLVWLILAGIAADQIREPDRIAAITRVSGLLLGVLIAIWSEKASYQNVKRLVAKTGPLPLLMCLATVAALPFLEPPEHHRSGLVAVCGAFAVLIASFDLGAITPSGLPRRLGLWLGARSYALYVIHVPLFFVIFDFSQHPGLLALSKAPPATALVIAASFALLLVLAELNFHCIERPLRDSGAALSHKIRRTNAQRDLARTA